jgi:hypothetical protein
MDEHPVTLAAVLPVRKTVADLLLELNQPDTALKEIQGDTAHRPPPVSQHPPRGPRRQAVGRHRRGPRHLSEAGGSEQSSRGRAPELAEAKANLTN